MSCNLILISWPLNSWSKPEHDELWLADWECLAFQPSHWTMGNQASRYRDDYSILYSSYSFENAIVLNVIFNRKSETKIANHFREYGKDGDLDPFFLFLFKIYITLAIFNISACRGEGRRGAYVPWYQFDDAPLNNQVEMEEDQLGHPVHCTNIFFFLFVYVESAHFLVNYESFHEYITYFNSHTQLG